MNTALLDRIKICLENPKYAGNIGMVCRLISNFSLSPLRVLGEPRELAFDIEWMAYNAEDELKKIEYVNSSSEMKSDLSILIGTGMVHGKDRGRFIHITEIPGVLRTVTGKIGIVFGREDSGLTRNTIDFCDYMVDFQLRGKQSSMNLSNSVAYLMSIIYNSAQPGSGMETPVENNIGTEHFYNYAKKIFEKLGMNEYHGMENLAVKRLRYIIDSRPLSKGDLDFIYTIFRNIEKNIVVSESD
ncbi:MAG: hypothetical protein K8R21_02990 [Leptospira sp.]|nr:hypothetical protein [Leptospira sp.]